VSVRAGAERLQERQVTTTPDPPPEVIAPTAREERPPKNRVVTLPVVVLAVGLLVAAMLAAGANALRNSNEDRLLREQVREASAVVTAAIGSGDGQLAAAAAVARATSGDPTAFRELFAPRTRNGRSYAAATLWRTDVSPPRMIASLGIPIALAHEDAAARSSFFARATSVNGVAVNDLLDGPSRRIGYGAASSDHRYLVYVEQVLPANRRAQVASNSAFANFDYALYLGSEARPDQVLASSTGGTALRGRQAFAVVPFDDSHLRLVMSPRSNLGGAFLAWLPVLLGVLGLLLALLTAGLVKRLVRRRKHAEGLAGDLESAASNISALYDEQRRVSETLQHSLLPDRLPQVDDFSCAARYVAGDRHVEIGGDWYDVMQLDDGRVFFALGDVSGRGVRAAAVMAALRYSIRAYAADGNGPAVVLSKLARLLHTEKEGHFATVLCGVADPSGHTVVFANAGHLPPLLISDGASQRISLSVGVPIGVRPADYDTDLVVVPSRATLLAFTDGLVEKRGEMLSDGYARLEGAVPDENLAVDDIVEHVLRAVAPAPDDDTAVLGMQWLT
jgi:serine phosphatase RsbU (regulator of sigma subunit)